MINNYFFIKSSYSHYIKSIRSFYILVILKKNWLKIEKLNFFDINFNFNSLLLY